ncbi:MAG: DUF971 domain-containing protein [Terriglobia bacterium]
MQPNPTKIRLAGGNDALTIEWSDGHLSVYPYRYLRDKCPCANCSELGARTPAADNPFPMLGAKPLTPEHAELVGRYALQIYWTDGHSAGIYSFEYLREICPCPDCTAKRKEALNS